MNRQNAAQYIPIMQAYADGKTLQVCSSTGDWYDMIVNPSFNLAPDKYRIKPEKKTGYIVINNHGRLLSLHIYADIQWARVDYPKAFAIIQITYEEGEGLASGDTNEA